MDVSLKIAGFVLDPSLASDIVVPGALFCIVLLINRQPTRVWSGTQQRIGVAWLISISVRGVMIPEFGQAFPGVTKLLGSAIPYPLGLILMLGAELAHVYVLIALLMMLAQMCGLRLPKVLERRAYPILLLSAGALFISGGIIRVQGLFGAYLFPDLALATTATLFVGLAVLSGSTMERVFPAPGSKSTPHSFAEFSENLAELASAATEVVTSIMSGSGTSQSNGKNTIVREEVSDVASSKTVPETSSGFTTAQPEISSADHAVPASTNQVPAIIGDPKSVHSARMQLVLKRAQRSGLTGKIIFTLDARMQVPMEEAQLVNKYRLGNLVIYDSTKRQKYAESMQGHLESTKDTPGFRDGLDRQLLGTGKMLYRFARAGVSAAMANLSLRVTVSSLMQGVHVECKSMDELLGAESAIVEAGKNLRMYLGTAETFDGREVVLEF